MPLNLQNFSQTLENLGLVPGKHRVLLACSGGMDSMLLAYLLRNCSINFSLAHCNFGLRDTESDGDAQLVTGWAAQQGIEVYTRQFDTLQYATSENISTQMAARELRYQWFDELLETYGFDYLLTAHHATDQVETVLLNMVRGSGLDGMQGIKPKYGKIIRPLLAFSRSEIAAYVKQYTIPYREDSSNASDKYARNLLRHHVLPILEQLSPAFEEKIGEMAAQVQQYRLLTDSLLAEKKTSFISLQGPYVYLRKDLPEPAAIYLYEWIREYGFKNRMISEIITAGAGIPGKIFHSPTHQLLVERRHYIIRAIPQSPPEQLLLEAGHTHFELNGIPYSLEVLDAPVTIEKNPAIGYFDADRLAFPLLFRPWQQGDTFVPLGMQGKKKVSDLLINEKTPLFEKESCYVMCSGDNIAWVVGKRADERFRITADTRKIARITPQ